MDDRSDHSRRAFLAWLGAGGVTTISGCSDSQGSRSAGRVTGASPSTESAVPPPVAATVQQAPDFDGSDTLEVIDHLAEQIGPREGTSDAFHRAADWVVERFTDLGYNVLRDDVPVPEGDASYRPEWGTVIEPGTSANVIADPPGFDPTQPHAVIGAHLDTVGVAPGAEDNASGIGVVLELARMLTDWPADVPVRLVAFGAEEPRGPGDSMHHFGSQQLVRNLSAAEREAVLGMVSLDRVGVTAPRVPVGWGGRGPLHVVNALLEHADDAGIPAGQTDNRSSDHWSFEKAGIGGARLGSVPYTAYHSARDLPGVIDPDQILKVGRLATAWLRSLSA